MQLKTNKGRSLTIPDARTAWSYATGKPTIPAKTEDGAEVHCAPNGQVEMFIRAPQCDVLELVDGTWVSQGETTAIPHHRAPKVVEITEGTIHPDCLLYSEDAQSQAREGHYWNGPRGANSSDVEAAVFAVFGIKGDARRSTGSWWDITLEGGETRTARSTQASMIHVVTGEDSVRTFVPSRVYWPNNN